MPLIGPLLFLLFGLRYSERTSLDVYRQKQNFKYETSADNLTLPIRQQLFHSQSKISNRGIYQGNFEVFASGPQGFEKVFADLSQAKHFIHVNYYIIKAGEIYDEFRALIVEKVRAGVKVRMIIDDIGRWGLPWYEMKFLRQQGVEIRILNRIHFPFIGSNNTYRNHRKLIIIDGRIVHTGGANIGDEYANLDKRFGVWLDYKARITGPIVRSYSLLFLGDWNSIGPPLEPLESYLLEDKNGGNSWAVLVEDGPEIDDNPLESSIVSWIFNAHKKIQIVTPYFIPTHALMSALKAATLRGVEVEIFIPGLPDKKSIYTATLFWVSQLRPYGVKVYQTRGMILHAKVGLFDDHYAYLGTFNFDFRSMHSQFECSALVQGDAAEQVGALIEHYRRLSSLAELPDLKQKSGKEGNMASFEAKIIDPVGLHARPAALVVGVASKFKSDATIGTNDRNGNLKSIMNVMALGVKKGDLVRIETLGDDADQAIVAIKKAMQANRLI
ncbi:uncharacterized protein LOC111627258 [Centruroides sculpturatus]|uniref:uncharacterized protein LOC111627258 n=1 Tax=Centruroides sculpturatus TaxID=218467 RepID=UPI000C6E1F58|nr:uncharacterized protein LOC111627258 [Centruroides sculpturatus]